MVSLPCHAARPKVSLFDPAVARSCDRATLREPALLTRQELHSRWFAVPLRENTLHRTLTRGSGFALSGGMVQVPQSCWPVHWFASVGPHLYNATGPSRPGEKRPFGCSPTVSAMGIRSSKSEAADPPSRPRFGATFVPARLSRTSLARAGSIRWRPHPARSNVTNWLLSQPPFWTCDSDLPNLNVTDPPNRPVSGPPLFLPSAECPSCPGANYSSKTPTVASGTRTGSSSGSSGRAVTNSPGRNASRHSGAFSVSNDRCRSN